MTDETIGRIEKNAREEIRASFSEFKGHQLIDLRVYAVDGDDASPTKKGIAVKVDKLPELARLIADAESEARRRGLLQD